MQKVVVNLEHEFQIEHVLGRKNSKVGLMYYVKWRGSKEATWQPITNLLSSLESIRQYERTRKKDNNQEKKRFHYDSDQSQNEGRRGRKKIFRADRIFPKRTKNEDQKIVKLKVKPEAEGKLKRLVEFQDSFLDEGKINEMEGNSNIILIDTDSAKSEKEDFCILVNYLEETPQLELQVQSQSNNQNELRGEEEKYEVKLSNLDPACVQKYQQQ